MIGILGASGAVGAHAARVLSRHGVRELRLGGRRVDSLTDLATELPTAADVVRVDAADAASLAAFVADCTVVVGCAGPSRRFTDRIALASWDGGADHVDAGGDAATAVRLAHARPGHPDRRSVLAAGAWPGLSGLFPRWLATTGFTSVDTLRTYIGARDRFTATAADDYLHGALGDATEPLAAWRHGRRSSAALTRCPDVSLPFFTGDVCALPYLDVEGEQVARGLGLATADWYSVFPTRWLDALDRVRTRSHDDAVADLRRAAALDVAGAPASMCFLAQLDGYRAEAPVTRTAVLRGPGVSALTGAVAAVAALAVARDELPAGAHTAATVLDPRSVLATLCDAAGGCEVTVLDTSIEALTTVEEGAL